MPLLTAQAQSHGSGRFVVEPFLGAFFDSNLPSYSANVESRFGVVGLRALWRRRYDRSIYAEVFGGSQSQADDLPSEVWTRVLGSVGFASTLVDRDATGILGIHMLLGLGGIWGRYRIDGANGPPPDRYFNEENAWFSPLAALAVHAELEITRRVLARGSANGYAGIDLFDERGESLGWFPGVSYTLGLGISL